MSQSPGRPWKTDVGWKYWDSPLWSRGPSSVISDRKDKSINNEVAKERGRAGDMLNRINHLQILTLRSRCSSFLFSLLILCLGWWNSPQKGNEDKLTWPWTICFQNPDLENLAMAIWCYHWHLIRVWRDMGVHLPSLCPWSRWALKNACGMNESMSSLRDESTWFFPLAAGRIPTQKA